MKNVKQTNSVLKVVFLGDPDAGKTCLLSRQVDDTFQQAYMATIGVQFKTKEYNIMNRKFKAQFWDTAGQQRFRSISSAYYRSYHLLLDANVIILCFDINNPQSFRGIEEWNQRMKVQAQNTPKFLVGCKKDLECQVAIDMILAFAQKNDLIYFETSAKTGEGVNEAMQHVIEQAIGYKMMGPRQSLSKQNKQIQVLQKQQQKGSFKKSSPCC